MTPQTASCGRYGASFSADPHGLGGPTPPGTEVPAQSAVPGPPHQSRGLTPYR